MARLLSYLTSQLALSSPLTSQHNALPQYSSHQPQLGAVASESATCSKIGTSLLLKGGNAADALVGTTLCVGVMGMYHSGLGGGGFATIRAPNGSYYDLDFRETAPQNSSENMFKDNYIGSMLGGLASGVPGELRGLEWIHKGFGKLAWEDVVTPAAELAREGFEVREDLVRMMGAGSRLDAPGGAGDFLVKKKEWAQDFAPNGTKLGLGDWITRKGYARTLERIAREGADVFYEGDMAEAMIRAVRKENGTMTLEDLKNYKVVLRKPAQLEYKGFKLTSNSAPASGTVALAVMNIVGGYEDFGWDEQLNLSTHRLDEAMRFGYGMRTELGDPSFVSNVTAYQETMLSSKTGKEFRSKISDSHSHPIIHYNPLNISTPEDHGTSHISVADHTGLAISLTTTINLLFGSHVLVPETGIIMNDEMNDFSIPHVSNAFGYKPSPENYIRPGKRPLSSISPTIVEFPNGTLYFVIGAAGGSKIISATIQNLWYVLDRNMTTAQALEQPRMHDQLIPDTVVFEYPLDAGVSGKDGKKNEREFEDEVGLNSDIDGRRFGYNNATTAFLRERGHNVTFMPPWGSSAQGVRVLGDGSFETAGEPRQKNSAGIVV